MAVDETAARSDELDDDARTNLLQLRRLAEAVSLRRHLDGGALSYSYASAAGVRVQNAVAAPPSSDRAVFWTGAPTITVTLPPSDGSVTERAHGLSAGDVIAEMMILGGSIAGSYAAEHDLPFLYRGQTMGDNPTAMHRRTVAYIREHRDPTTGRLPRTAATVDLKLPSVVITTTPTEHMAMGVPAYSHATSPLRRVTDLAGHWQLHSHLLGRQPVYSRDALDCEAARLNAAWPARHTERRAVAFWTLYALARALKRSPEERPAVLDRLTFVGRGPIDHFRGQGVYLRDGLVVELGIKAQLEVHVLATDSSLAHVHRRLATDDALPVAIAGIELSDNPQLTVHLRMP